MFGRRIFSVIFIILSLVALGFLLYTLINLDALEMTVTHPRVIVEFSLFLSFLLIGVLLRHRK
jgi:hypothetical protein